MFLSHLYRQLLFCFFVVLQIFEHLRNINDNRCSYESENYIANACVYETSFHHPLRMDTSVGFKSLKEEFMPRKWVIPH